MGADTKIEWAHHTLNPWIGCQKVSPGCDHCYAEALATNRLGVAWGPHAERQRTKPATWNQARKWNREAARLGVRYRVFCASLADVFDPAVDPLIRADLAGLVEQTPNLDWLFLTKRIGNAAHMMRAHMGWTAPPSNVWIGATIVNQAEADRDVPKLLATPAAKRFLSMEPLLEPVRLDRIHEVFDGGLGHSWESCLSGKRFDIWSEGDLDGYPKLDWAIVGGESGAGARPMHPDWARSLRNQCAAADVPFLFKQWGEWIPAGDHLMEDRPEFLRLKAGDRAYAFQDGQVMARVGKKAAGRLLDGETHDGFPA